MDVLVFSLGMVELISYWKLTCSPYVCIEAGSLTDDQIEWWKKLYYKGLGEFFYTNGIKIDQDFMRIECLNNKTLTTARPCPPKAAAAAPKVLIPVGGGKDSVVTLELLKDAVEGRCYLINPSRAARDTVSISDFRENTITATRVLDANLPALNSKGFLNGHTPFSAIVAFSSVIAAYINNLAYVALSNESDANEPTVLNSDINHQYSKSYEFELDFRHYVSRYLCVNVEYFSVLRPLTELRIAELFASFKKYHKVFRSCNVAVKSNMWCGKCSKCLFVYIILSPFLSDGELMNIFGKNMFDDIDLLDIFEKLTGLQSEKPFECVGSRGDVNLAVQAVIGKYKANGESLPMLLEQYKDSSYEKHPVFNENNSLPPYFLSLVKKRILS
jgi:hypothetical protein